MATVTARALREKGNKDVSLGGITRCDRTTGKSRGQAPQLFPFSPRLPGPCPQPGSGRGGEPRPSKQRHTGTARVHPAPGATTTSVPTAEHREAGTTGRHEGPGGGGGRRRRRWPQPPLGRSAGGTASGGRSPEPRGPRKPPPGDWRHPSPREDRPRETQRARRRQPRKHPGYLPDCPPLRTPAARPRKARPPAAAPLPAARRRRSRPPALNRR
ncbi:basic salivary proline-rich protein 2-like [Aquila chrysaetos chrysaetos]|uniref:basic salivary proline-rich protein 2-like n=1 Tax=Aquila chrysaetos chrysaetos TaxID=223781 RepID=UPI0011772701|nr:basic salivary proline-rich protein 2-like [Aquila chrysaetos chrysaetos]